MAFYHWQQIPSNKIYCIFCDLNTIEDKIHFLCTFDFHNKLRDTLFQNINYIEPSVINISAMLGIALLTFLLNDKFVEYVADFIPHAWYKRQMHYLTESTLCCFSLYYYYCQIYIAPLYILHFFSIMTNKSSRAGYFI